MYSTVQCSTVRCELNVETGGKEIPQRYWVEKLASDKAASALCRHLPDAREKESAGILRIAD
jgi:hypothetical protein